MSDFFKAIVLLIFLIISGCNYADDLNLIQSKSKEIKPISPDALINLSNNDGKLKSSLVNDTQLLSYYFLNDKRFSLSFDKKIELMREFAIAEESIDDYLMSQGFHLKYLLNYYIATRPDQNCISDTECFSPYVERD